MSTNLRKLIYFFMQAPAPFFHVSIRNFVNLHLFKKIIKIKYHSRSDKLNILKFHFSLFFYCYKIYSCKVENKREAWDHAGQKQSPYPSKIKRDDQSHIRYITTCICICMWWDGLFLLNCSEFCILYILIFQTTKIKKKDNNNNWTNKYIPCRCTICYMYISSYTLHKKAITSKVWYCNIFFSW